MSKHKFPKFRKYLDAIDHEQEGIAPATYFRYKAGIVPSDFVGLLAAHPIAGYDLVLDLIESKAGALPPNVAALAEYARRELASMVASAEICQPESKIAA